MARIDIIAIEGEARRLRAEDLRRGEPVFAERFRLCIELYGESLRSLDAVLNGMLRPLFSWNPQANKVHPSS